MRLLVAFTSLRTIRLSWSALLDCGFLCEGLFIFIFIFFVLHFSVQWQAPFIFCSHVFDNYFRETLKCLVCVIVNHRFIYKQVRVLVVGGTFCRLTSLPVMMTSERALQERKQVLINGKPFISSLLEHAES